MEITLEYRRGIDDSIAKHKSFPIPDDVAHCDAVTHLLEVLIRALSLLRRQESVRSASIGAELSDCRTACHEDTQVIFEGIDVRGWHHAPYTAVSLSRAYENAIKLTGSVCRECLFYECSRSSNAQQSYYQTKAKHDI